MEECNWSKEIIDDIIEKISENKIVPLIGTGVYYIKEGKSEKTVQEYVVEKLLENEKITLGVDDSDRGRYTCGYRGMTKLERLYKNSKLTLYNHIRSIYKSEDFLMKLRMKPEVKKFLENGNFPLILTTCNFRYLESVIPKYNHEDGVIAYQMARNKDQDIPMDVCSHPTLFHLFGFVQRSIKAVITEAEFLKYLHCIQDTGKSPERLKDYLTNKDDERFILSLGCDIPNWTFRFLLYSLKEQDGELKGNGMDDSFEGGAFMKSLDEELEDFLSDIGYLSNDEIDRFLENVNNQLVPQKKPSIFLSVNNEEYETYGESIKRKLENRFDVWFFKDKGESRYWKSIKEGIESCDFFMPVTTNVSIEKILNGSSLGEEGPDKEIGLITELRIALEKKKKLENSRIYCIPYLVGISIPLLKTALMKGECADLWNLFFGDDATVNAITTPIENFAAEELLKYIQDK